MTSPQELPPQGRTLEFEIPSDVRFIERIVDAVRAECRSHRFDERHLALNVPVALTEALSNAILRGNERDRAKLVRVRAVVDEIRLVIEVADEGSGFDLETSLRDPTTPERLMAEDGRGLFLMLRLMDRVERVPVPGGSLVRMVLHRAS
ncbi:MAG: ATP-binding protein [Gemmatimonadota bacterium]|nr:ATP-binding protein [Gemmatimonadota bacterium]MDE3128959.1 ATP-binding protein [Gemmatimonadota bacterium]MDE3171645.1 ATP-binding protein [Gemmatimonadota bacterium]MDE3216214.1 ATP-binding protein [Gemmatimonadota bacterium]